MTKTNSTDRNLVQMVFNGINFLSVNIEKGPGKTEALIEEV